MIFFIAATILAIISIYLIAGQWLKNSFRIIFAIVSSLLIALLILFGIDLKIDMSQPEAERRIVTCAVDVSASCGLDAGSIKEIIENESTEYNLEILPFSDSLRGPENAESTSMVDSLKELLSYISAEYDDDKIAGLIIISDGNETEKIAELKKEFQLNGKYPHNVIYIEKKIDPSVFDKSVVFTDVPRFMPRFKKEKIAFAVNVSGTGLNAVPVELKLDWKNLGSVLVNIADGYGEGEFDLIIKETGNFLLEASVALDSREKHTANNRDFAHIEGIMKGFRVLHISGHPSTDTAFIRRGLQNIPGVDMISFYILRTRKNLMNTPNAEMSLIPFPTDQLFRKELDNFDIIIMNDFLLSEFLIPTYINNIAKFVKSGGGLFVMGGEQSFQLMDYVITNFGKIVPVMPAPINNWRKDLEYTMVPLDICRLTSLSKLCELDGMRFKGLNKVNLKETANILCRTSKGSPLVAAAPAGKGRVITVMTDSLWHASYYGGINNETLLKSFVRYLLGISTMPIKIYADAIAFDKNMITDAMKDIKAELSFRDPSGGVMHTSIITPTSPYSIKENDSRLVDVKILNKDKLLDTYKLVNFNEKRDNEHSYVPSGRTFLQRIADDGDGSFVQASDNDIKNVLGDMDFRKPVLVTDKKLSRLPLYRHKGFLVLFLLLGVLS